MSTIVVVKKDGFAVIAADSMTTRGTEKESAKHIVNHEKIIQVGHSFLSISGPTSAKLCLKHYFSDKTDVDLSNVDAIFRVWVRLHAALKNQYFLNPHEDDGDAFQSTRIDVLIANPHGIFGVEAHRAVREFSDYYAYGTGWQLALGAMHALYSQANRSAEDVARSAIEAAEDFDTDTGAPITLHSLRLGR
jgi:ATP-dependent protease HslVU (ClpYQ) peptidase subunit